MFLTLRLCGASPLGGCAFALKNVWIMLAGLSLIGSTTGAADQPFRFLYAVQSEGDSQINICWFAVSTPDEDTCVEVRPFDAYAISPDGRFVAVRQQRVNDRGGNIGIVDLQKQQTRWFDLYQPTQEFLWDHVYAVSGTLLWSPDGRFLAFTGVLGGEADVYRYDVDDQILANLTSVVPIIRALITPAAWSPDGQWLTLYGAWSEYQDEAERPVPKFGAAVISREGEAFREIAPGYNTCRLVWSPDMQWLASDTDCFTLIGASSGLMFVPFNPTVLAQDGRRVDEILSPLYVDWHSSPQWNYRYGPPLWMNANTIIAYREITPVSFGYLTSEQTLAYSSEGLVAIDIQTHSETLVEAGSFAHRLENWFVTAKSVGEGITAFNPLLDKRFSIPADIDFCPVSYALKIDSQGEFVAVLNACGSTTPMVRVYETGQFEMIAVREGMNLQLLGFTER